MKRVAALALTVIMALSLTACAKMVSIDAEYIGSRDPGTVVSTSDIKVTAKYDNDTEKEISDFTVEDYTLHPGLNYISVSAGDCETDTVAIAPLIKDGKYIGTVQEIKDLVEAYARVEMEDFTGFAAGGTTETDVEFEGLTDALITMIFADKSKSDGNVSNDEIPTTVSIMAGVPTSTLETGWETTATAAGVILAMLDNDASDYNAIRDDLRSTILSAMKSWDGELTERTGHTDNVDYTVMFTALPGDDGEYRAIIMVSFEAR